MASESAEKPVAKSCFEVTGSRQFDTSLDLNQEGYESPSSSNYKYKSISLTFSSPDTLWDLDAAAELYRQLEVGMPGCATLPDFRRLLFHLMIIIVYWL